VDAVARLAHHGHDLLDRGWVGGVAHPLVGRRPTGVKTLAWWPVSDGGRRHRATAQT
jgi:hypothetical protein